MPTPFAKASVKTMTNGITRTKNRKASAVPINAQRTAAGSVNGSRSDAVTRAAGSFRGMASTAMTPPGPGLNQVHHEQQHERGDQHQSGDHGGAGIIELLQ